MSLYEVVLRATYKGQECINRWNYVAPTEVPASLGAFTLLGALGFFQEGDPLAYPTDKMFYNIFHMVVSACAFTDVYAKNIYDPTDFYEAAINPVVNGSQGSGAALSPINAFGFRTSRVRTDIARGTKRFAGVAGELTQNEGDINATGIGLLNSLAAVMEADVSEDSAGVSYTFKPTIVSKLKYTTPSGHSAYKYYATLAAQSAHWAQNFVWQPYTNVRSQTSRQVGRGI